LCLEANSVGDIINRYKKEGKFNFEGSILSVSALNGSIIWNGQPITEKNFFNHWIKEEKEITKPMTSNKNGR